MQWRWNGGSGRARDWDEVRNSSRDAEEKLFGCDWWVRHVKRREREAKIGCEERA